MVLHAHIWLVEVGLHCQSAYAPSLKSKNLVIKTIHGAGLLIIFLIDNHH